MEKLKRDNNNRRECLDERKGTCLLYTSILFLELGVGRMTPMFIQEPFWNLTLNLPDAYYIAVNEQYDFLPKDIEEKGMVIKGDIAKVLKDAAEGM